MDETSRDKFESGRTYEQFLEAAEKHRGLWEGVYKHLALPEDALIRLNNLPGLRRVIVLSADWCGDAASLVPILARMADAAPHLIELRILERDENLDIMDDHLSHGGRAIPVAIVYDDEWRKLGWWGPRPGPAQALFREKLRAFQAGELTDKNEQVNKPVLRWYREDRGRHTIEEFLVVLERGGSPRS